MCDSVTPDTVVRKWLSCKPYLLTVALPSGSLTWNGAMAFCSVQKPFVCLIQLLVTHSPRSLTTKAHFPNTLINLLLPFCCQQCLLRFSSTTFSLFQLLLARFVGFFFAIRLQLDWWSACPRARFNWTSLQQFLSMKKEEKINVCKLDLHLAAANCLQIGPIMSRSCTRVVFGQHYVLEWGKWNGWNILFT